MKDQLVQFYSPGEEKVNVVDPKASQWTREIVRDYSWVMKKASQWDVEESDEE